MAHFTRSGFNWNHLCVLREKVKTVFSKYLFSLCRIILQNVYLLQDKILSKQEVVGVNDYKGTSCLTKVSPLFLDYLMGGVYVCVRESSFVLEQSILLRAHEEASRNC